MQDLSVGTNIFDLVTCDIEFWPIFVNFNLVYNF